MPRCIVLNERSIECSVRISTPSVIITQMCYLDSPSPEDRSVVAALYLCPIPRGTQIEGVWLAHMRQVHLFDLYVALEAHFVITTSSN
jgi:hypothetical protein